MSDVEIGRYFYPNHAEEDSQMAHYYQTVARKTWCEVCGEFAWCDVFAAEYPEQGTGYIDESAMCADCRRERE